MGDRLPTIWAQTMQGIQEAHNGYLEVYLNLGWIGIGLLAVVIVKGYGNVIAELRRDRMLGSLKLAYFVMAIIYSFTEAGFREQTLTWTFLLVATSYVRPLSQPEPAAETEPEEVSRFERLRAEYAFGSEE